MVQGVNNRSGVEKSACPRSRDMAINNLQKLNDKRPARVLWLIFILLAAGIVLASLFNYRSRERHFKREMGHKLVAIGDLKAGEILQWKTERLRDAEVFFRNPVFAGLVRDFFARPKDSTLEKKLRTWIGLIQQGYDYDRVRVLDSRGVVRLSVPDTEEPLSPVIKGKVAETLQSRRITFVDFFRQEHSRKISLAFLVPIPDDQEGSRPLGVLSLRIDPEIYLYPFIQRWPSPSETAETLLVRREGKDALYLNELKFQKNAALTLRIPLGNQDVPSVKAVLGWKGIVEGIDYRGVPVLAAVRAIPDSPWFLVARMDAAEVYKPMRETMWLMLLLVGALILGAGAGVGLIWRQQRLHVYRERSEAAETLQRANDELERRVEERTAEIRFLSSRLLTAQEKERKRIAIDLHDGIGGLLSAIKYKTEAAQQVNDLEEVVALLQRAIEECRRIQLDLRPPLLDDLGLLATFNWLIREFQKRIPGLTVEKQFEVEEQEIPKALRTVIFRVTQEALNNIAKYSEADGVLLSLEKTKGALVLVVRDNGRGFEVEKALTKESTERGLGLASMRERTELSGGTFSIESAPGKGTVVRVTWPGKPGEDEQTV
jgi:signal transduction histidine kinase